MNPAQNTTLPRQRWTIAAVVAVAFAGFAARTAPPVAAQLTPLNAEFAAFLSKADAAQRELQNGDPAAYKALWSHADDVTLSGGFGGAIEKGWPAVGKRLDWVATQFSNGSNRIERVAGYASGDVGYLVQSEYLRYRVPATGADATREYRVTMIFRRESGEWRIVHRQADSQVTKAGAQ
jgi:ketosteroid isomerase-like protein